MGRAKRGSKRLIQKLIGIANSGALLSYLEETQVDSNRIFDVKWIEKAVIVEKSRDHLLEGRSDAGAGCDPPADYELLKSTGDVQTDRREGE